MGRFGVDVDGMGADQRQSRFHRLLAAIRRSGGHCPCQSRCVGVQRDQFLVWGWRIPFLISIIMVGVGLYIRLGVLETPVFSAGLWPISWRSVGYGGFPIDDVFHDSGLDCVPINCRSEPRIVR
jgi:hypothetical protein